MTRHLWNYIVSKNIFLFLLLAQCLCQYSATVSLCVHISCIHAMYMQMLRKAPSQSSSFLEAGAMWHKILTSLTRTLTVQLLCDQKVGCCVPLVMLVSSAEYLLYNVWGMGSPLPLGQSLLSSCPEDKFLAILPKRPSDRSGTDVICPCVFLHSHHWKMRETSGSSSRIALEACLGA